MTMIQEVENTVTICVPRVRIQLNDVKRMVNEIKEVCRQN